MTTPIRLAAVWTLTVIASCALPAFAQNNGPAAPAAKAVNNGYGNGAPAYDIGGTGMQTPADRQARNYKREEDLLGAPHEYGGADTPQDNTEDAQRAALLDERRMTVLGGAANAKPAGGKAQR